MLLKEIADKAHQKDCSEEGSAITSKKLDDCTRETTESRLVGHTSLS